MQQEKLLDVRVIETISSLYRIKALTVYFSCILIPLEFKMSNYSISKFLNWRVINIFSSSIVELFPTSTVKG